MRNGFYPPEDIRNPNVPDGARILGHVASMSGEIIYTYFVLNNRMYEVSDWVGRKPVPVSEDEMERLRARYGLKITETRQGRSYEAIHKTV